MCSFAKSSVLVIIVTTVLTAQALACFKTSIDTVRLRSHRMYGTLKGGVIPGMRVSLYRKDSSFVFVHYDANSVPLRSAESDEKGKFSFGDVPSGSYVLTGGTLEAVEIVVLAPIGTQDDQLNISSIGFCQRSQAVDAYGMALFSDWSYNKFFREYWGTPNP